MGREVHGPNNYDYKDALRTAYQHFQMQVHHRCSKQPLLLIVLDYAGWTDKLAGEQYPAQDGFYRVSSASRLFEEHANEVEDCSV